MPVVPTPVVVMDRLPFAVDVPNEVAASLSVTATFVPTNVTVPPKVDVDVSRVIALPLAVSEVAPIT